MSVVEIIEAVKRLTPAEQHEVIEALDRLAPAASLHELLTAGGVCTGVGGRLEPFDPPPIYLDPPLSETMLAEQR